MNIRRITAFAAGTAAALTLTIGGSAAAASVTGSAHVDRITKHHNIYVTVTMQTNDTGDGQMSWQVNKDGKTILFAELSPNSNVSVTKRIVAFTGTHKLTVYKNGQLVRTVVVRTGGVHGVG